MYRTGWKYRISNVYTTAAEDSASTPDPADALPSVASRRRDFPSENTRATRQEPKETRRAPKAKLRPSMSAISIVLILCLAAVPLCRAVYYDGFTTSEGSDLCTLGMRWPCVTTDTSREYILQPETSHNSWNSWDYNCTE